MISSFIPILVFDLMIISLVLVLRGLRFVILSIGLVLIL